MEKSGKEEWYLRLVDVDGIGEDVDDEVGVDEGLKGGEIVPSKIGDLAMADLYINLK